MQDLFAIQIVLDGLLLVLMSAFTVVTIKWSRLWRPHFTVVEYIVGMLIFAGVTHLSGAYGLIENTWLAYERWLTWYCCLATAPVTIGYMIYTAREKAEERRIRRENQERGDDAITSA